MQIKAIWRTAGSTALILAAGLWVGLASPLSVTAASAQASSAASTPDKPMSLKKFTKPAKSKKSARAKSHDNAKSTEEASAKQENAPAKKASAKTSTKDSAKDGGSNWSERDANANASMLQSNDAFAATGATVTLVQADNLLKQMGGESAAPADAVSPAALAQPAAQVTPADQLNDLDKTIAVDHDKPALMLASASLDTSHASASTGNDSNPWDKTSLIGRIFIAFGGLLTLASAARMMIA